MKLPIVISVLGILLGHWALAAALAAPQQCSRLQGESKRVLFGTPSTAGGAAADLPAFMDELIFAFEIERERRWVEGSERVAFLQCVQQGLISNDTWDGQVDYKYRLGVVLEIRSLLKSRTGAGGPAREAIVQYASAPAAFGARSGATPLDGIFGVRVEIAREGSFLDAFVRPLDIDAYVATGLGLRYLDERLYDLALSNLCKARQHLAQIEVERAASLTSRQAEAMAELAGFVKSRIGETARRGEGEATGPRITAFAHARPDSFAADPCALGGS